MKKCSVISLFLALILCIPISASAHAGDTDAYGGHYDHSTGEYHYHHGYPAHQHYDMDGDGFRDCPYDFDDQTGANSGSSSGSGGSSGFTPATYQDGLSDGYDFGYSDGHSEGYDAGYKKGQEIETSGSYDEGYAKGAESLYGLIGFLVLALLIACIAFFVVNKKKTATISALEHNSALLVKQHENQLKSISDTKSDIVTLQNEITERRRECGQLQAKLTLEQNALCTLRAQMALEQTALENTRKHRQRLKDAPPYITFTDNGEPVYWKPDPQKPYGDYTVYLNKAGTIYHTDRFCASYTSSIRHIFAVISTARPCEKCAKQAFDFPAPPKWYTQTPSNLTPQKTYTTGELEEKALQMGVSLEIAKRIITLEHNSKGLPPAEFEEFEHTQT